MRIRSTFLTVLVGLLVICAAAGSEVFGQGSGKGNAGKAASPYIGPPMVDTNRGTRRSTQVAYSQPGRHRGWKHKKYTYGYRNYGQYRRTQVGNRRYRMVKRYYWVDGIRRYRTVRVYF